MAVPILCIYISSFLIIRCCGIGPDYYAENDESEGEYYYLNDTLNKSRRISDNFETLDTINSTTSNITVRYNYSHFAHNEYEDDDFKIFVVTVKIPHSKSVNSENSKEDTSKHHTNVSILRQKKRKPTNSTPTTVSTINGFNDYQYIYDDEGESEQLRQQLRHDINVTQTDNPSHPHYSDGTTQYDNDSLKYLADFYNLEPAAGTINIENPAITGKLINNSVWYVPEKYTCWELPVLYAELGQKIKTSDVFLIYPSHLKNVIDAGIEDIPTPKNFIVPAAQTLNKWCAAEPCYGDHTLCIFANKVNSQMCDKNYKVLAPNMIEQTALVNTLNSMRNRVANGVADQYLHLPPAANMKQIIYDFDLEDMAKAWLRQCLPGPAPCSSLDSNYVTQLECTKYAEHCCANSYKSDKVSKCIPEFECFVLPIIGCMHAWFCSAGLKLSETDVKCGHIAPSTFNTVQLIWAHTSKIGCAFGHRSNGDVRVVCNFAPGAPFLIDTKYYCGFIAHRDVTNNFKPNEDITDLNYLASLGIHLQPLKNEVNENITHIKSYGNDNLTNILRTADLDGLHAIYQQGWVRRKLNDNFNGTMGMMARLVTRYSFYEEGESRCDSEEPIYVAGAPGSICVERGRRFNALCYDFRDPTPGYRLVAVLAPVALFSLILYDLFSGVMRQTNF